MESNKIMRIWANSSMRDVHVALGVFAAVSHVVGNLADNEKLHVLAEIVVVFAIFHYFIHGYFYHRQKFFSNHQKMYSLPKTKIAKIGRKYLGVFVVAASVGMAVVKEIYDGTLVKKLKAMCTYLLGIIFGAILKTDGLGKDDLVLKETKSLLGTMDQISAKPDSLWEEIVNHIQSVLVIVGVVFLVVVVGALLMNYIRHIVDSTKLNTEDGSGKNVTDKEERLRERMKKDEKLLDFSPTAKVRRTYRKYIRKRKRRGQIIPTHCTPAEIERIVSLPRERTYLELHDIYEKARYSKSGCTKEDVEYLKILKM